MEGKRLGLEAVHPPAESGVVEAGRAHPKLNPQGVVGLLGDAHQPPERRGDVDLVEHQQLVPGVVDGRRVGQGKLGEGPLHLI